MNPEIKNLSISDLRALILSLREREDLCTYAENNVSAKKINFQVQQLEDLIDEKIEALGIILY